MRRIPFWPNRIYIFLPPPPPLCLYSSMWARGRNHLRRSCPAEKVFSLQRHVSGVSLFPPRRRTPTPMNFPFSKGDVAAEHSAIPPLDSSRPIVLRLKGTPPSGRSGENFSWRLPSNSKLKRIEVRTTFRPRERPPPSFPG